MPPNYPTALQEKTPYFTIQINPHVCFYMETKVKLSNIVKDLLGLPERR